MKNQRPQIPMSLRSLLTPRWPHSYQWMNPQLTTPNISLGTRTPSLGNLTFPLILNYVDDMRTVSESAIIEAVQFLFYRMKLVVEPSGALGVAALLSRAVTPKGRVGIIISGGNVDADTMMMILNS